MTWRDQVVAAAHSRVGVAELTGHNDGPVAEFMTLSDGTVREVAYCAYFAVWCYLQAGIRISRTLAEEWQVASVATLRERLAGIGRLRGEQEHPLPGDIIFFKGRGDSDSGPGNHCGIVTKVTDAHIHTVEGNVSNRVARRRYKHDSKRIWGYGFCEI